MRAQLAVQSGASHAQEYAQIPAGPSRILCTAVGAPIIARHAADQVLQRSLVARLLPLTDGARHGKGRKAERSGDRTVRIRYAG